MKLDTRTTLLILAALVVAGGLYWYFFPSSSEGPTLSGTSAAGGTEFDELLSELGPVSFDTSIFSDPRFNALIDIATPITPEPSGRVDPFAPIPGLKGK